MRQATLIATGLCLCLAHEVQAEPQPTARFTYLRTDSASSCPDEETMRRGVAARLGREPFDTKADRALTVRLEAAESGYRADISVQDAEGNEVGKRSLSTDREDCAELASAMQLAIAIAIDPMHSMPKPAPQPAAEPPALVAPALAQAPSLHLGPPLPPPPPGTKEQASRHLGAGLLLAASTEPNPSIGLTLHYAHRSEHSAWAIEGRIDNPSEVSAMTGQVQTSLWAGSFLMCLRPQAFDLCGVASLGRIWGRGSGYEESASFQTLYAAGGVRLARLFSVQGNFGIQVSTDLLGRLNTTTLLVDNEEVWSSSRMEFGIGARALWRLK